jgi:two-component system phosphate regulon sensor histidine kinase PhoR
VLGAAGALVAVFAAVTAVLALASLLLALAAVSSARSAAAAARSIAAGDYSARASAPRGEPAALGESFNAMAKSVQESLAAASYAQGRLMAALNSSIDAIVAVDAGGRIAFANDAARRLLSPRGQELLGTPFAYWVPDARLVEALRASSEERRSLSVSVERPNRQYLQAVTTPIVGGGEWASLAVFHDLSEVRRTEEVRRDFIANVSHELRTPLAALKSVIETLEGGAKNDPASAADFLARADSEVDRLVRLVEELLELSRLESGEAPLSRVPLDIARLVRDTVARLLPQAERAGVSLTVEVKEGPPPVSADAEMLERVVVNLVSNAIKFTPPGGAVRVWAAPEDGSVRVSVSDTGVGILPEDLPRIFERFFKADRSRGGGGAGLGLAIARHAVEAHGGAISATSTPGEGSTFTFTIPAETS